MAVYLHFHDKDFEETKHPRAKGGAHAGEFVKKGTGASTGKSTKPSEKPVEAKKTGSSTANFLPAAKGEKSHTAQGGGELPEHIKKLKIPPAWTDVRYSPHPDSPLLAIGVDAKGRSQRLYSEKFSQSQSAAKFARIKKLEGEFDKAVAKNKEALSSKEESTKQVATALALIMSTGVRPGSERETGAKRKAYGATTLLGQHVTTDAEGVLRLKFPGKSGKDLDIPVRDKAVAAMLTRAAKKAGPDEQIFPLVSERALLAHVKQVTGGQFKSKDFRTLLGTKLAMAHVKKIPTPKNPTAYKKAVKDVATQVSKALGNTPTIALQSYISPFVFAEWRLSAGV